ncbi:hypothetical protein SAY86_010481 [Trapa natans]|uniref:PPIase cyclophilin-type domain-containing protein n=1 Tax=Trapa natans TaxID=22666 RepID=A0AAN7R5I4_TRANT|nr:hypothetical protein SAY86_010481 [Trapa natans]
MARRQLEAGSLRFASLSLLLIGAASCTAAYFFLFSVLRPATQPTPFYGDGDGDPRFAEAEGTAIGSECCGGIEHLELWGAAVKWGAEFMLNTSGECCRACKAMCSENGGPCLCNSWVFCGNREACGSRFGECWLKKQQDSLAPERQEEGPLVGWTSGLIYGRGEGIIGLETEYGTIHIKLFPDCAPHSVNYILELLALKHCAGCQFYRAESRGQFWDSNGNHVNKAPFGPPFALIQGTIQPQGTAFPEIPTEACPAIKRGSVAWVGNGPEFFISLANHNEWKKSHTVFGLVLPEDMVVAEKIAQLPTVPDIWNNIEVSVLENSVPLVLNRRKTEWKSVSTNSQMMNR